MARAEDVSRREAGFEGEARLEARGLACSRNDRVLFSGLGFTLQQGEVLQIEGHNGSGKTTLLRLLCGLTPGDEGDILWCGSPVAEVRGEYLTSLAYEGHALGIKYELTPLENLRVASALLGGEPGLDAEDALCEIGLAEHVDTPCRALSAGQRRRVALARLLVAHSRLWILDEPFTALDRTGIAMVETMLAGHAARGGMAILTTHRPMDWAADRLTRLNLTP